MDLIIFLSLMASILCIRALYPHWRLRRWRGHWKQQWQWFQRLYADVDGFDLSKQARGDDTDPALVYGEVDFFAFIAALSMIHPKAGDVFYDLGSGSGKAVVTAALSYPMKSYQGIELLGPLHQAANEVKKQLAKVPEGETLAEKIHFVHGNILQQAIADADIVFINATGFFDSLWDDIITHLQSLKPGTRLLVTSKHLPEDSFHLQHDTQMMMSWGPCYLRVYSRL